jgi:putative transposase
MHFEPGGIYHVYNRGNQKQTIFFSEKNYLFFLAKIRQEWLPYCDILCYCLMPNHFHFIIIPNEKACKYVTLGSKETHMQVLSKVIGKTLSSYTKAIQIQENISGNLFQKKTKAKRLDNNNDIKNICSIHDYLLTCFFYIHNNPLSAGLVKHYNEWQFSSWKDYFGYRNGSLCNKELAIEKLGLSQKDLKEENVMVINQKIVDYIF